MRLAPIEPWVSSFGQDDAAALYECEECAATFHTARYLVDHCRLQHSKKDLPEPKYANGQEQDAAVMAYWDRYVCTECDYRFSDSGHFERHKAWYKDDRPWVSPDVGPY
ncbi:hypothetical protein V8C43DRAFT_301988 [Trichoderma afarasin]